MMELKVLDYYASAPTGYGEWDGMPFELGRDLTAGGAPLKGVVRLQLI